MSYTKNTWHDGDTITAAGLNNMETGIKNADTAASAAAAAAADAVAGIPVRVPFTLTVDAQTGAMSATTDADFSETCSAVSAGNLVWADVIVNGDGVESHYRGIINADVAESGTGNRITVSVIDSVNNGLNLGVYRIKWDATGCIPTRYTLTTT